jgi:hypothetical protein
MLKTTCATIALMALTLSQSNPALAAAGCANAADTAALKTAVMQQELMVAALQCHETGAYNRFVTSYRGELQASDATLKSFFVRRGGEHGEAGYDTFKTKAANLSALEQARDSRSFCADAHALFAAAEANRGTLASFVTERAADIGNACAESRPVMTAAAVTTPAADRPPIAAPTRRVETVKIAAVGGAADVKARPALAQADVVGGVPDHAAPMMPWRHEDRAVAPREDRDDYDDDADARASSAAAGDEDLPPARARAYEIRDRRTDDGYYGNAPYADRQEVARDDDQYGPPPSWYRPRRAPRWAPPPGYYNW